MHNNKGIIGILGSIVVLAMIAVQSRQGPSVDSRSIAKSKGGMGAVVEVPKSAVTLSQGILGVAGKTPTLLGDDIDGFVMLKGKGLRFETRETIGDVSGGSSGVLVSNDVFSTSYDVDGYHAIGSHEIYVWGRTDKGYPIIEQWSFAPHTEGYWVIMRQKHKASVKGDPVSLEDNVEKLLKGVFTPKNKRWKSMKDTRYLVYEDDMVGKFSTVCPDAEGRYLLYMLEGDGAVYQLWLSNGEVSVIANSTTYPVLSREVLASSTWNSAIWGRCFLLSFTPTDFTDQELSNFLMCDVENDGVFDIVEPTSPEIEAIHDAFLGRIPKDMR